MSEQPKPQFSRSEDAGIVLVPPNAERILSVGISTGGIAEMRMAENSPNAHIVATTIDQRGAAFAKETILENGLRDRIDVRIEDVTKPMPYPDENFDYIYARLVLHYLSKPDLAVALDGLHRVVKTGGNLFAVVRSTDCPDAKQPGAPYDPETGFTTSTGSNGDKYDRTIIPQRVSLMPYPLQDLLLIRSKHTTNNFSLTSCALKLPKTPTMS